MKGIIRKTNSKNILNPSELQWVVEYQQLLPHAGVSKMGTGPGVGKKFYVTKTIPLHPHDVFNPDGTLFAEDGKEIEFEIDHSTPLGMVLGQEQFSGIMQQVYGVGAKVTHVTWDDIRDFMLSDEGLGDEESNKAFKWVIEEFKKRNYEIPKKAITEIRLKKLKNES